MSDSEKKSYKDSLCLPQTSFAMKANLVPRPPRHGPDGFGIPGMETIIALNPGKYKTY